MGESRNDILNWVNTLLQLNYSKIEQLGSGAAYCQIIDSIYNDIPLGKVKFDANQEFQYIANYKVLQAAFNKHHISNAIPVEKLTKLRCQDNLEFSQWIKKFWESNFNNENYDAASRRGGASTGNAAPVQKKSAHSEASMRTNHPPEAMSALGGSTTTGPATAARSAPSAVPSAHTLASRAVGGAAAAKKLSTTPREMELANENVTLKMTLNTIERERDFYFSKLRQLEILLQVNGEELQKDELIKRVQEILYSNDNEDCV